VPPCAIGDASPCGIAETKSLACAISSAAQSCSSVASGLPNRRFDATVPVNRYARCGTMPIRAHSSSGSRSRTSIPSIRTVPAVGSLSLGISSSSVVLPAPVEPMIAVTFPGSAVNEMSSSTGAAAPG
jgi:hypothetical protein